MKKKIALLLSLTMMAAFVGCGESDSSSNSSSFAKQEDKKEEVKTLVGEWETTIDGTDYFVEGLKEDETVAEYVDVDEFLLTMYFEFDEDGNYETSIDVEEFEDQIYTVMRDLLEAMLEDIASQAGMTLDELLTESGYNSLDEAAEEALAEAGVEDLVSQFEFSGTYEYDDDTVTVNDGDEVWTIDFGKSTEFEIVEIETNSTDSLLTEDILPITFEKR